MIYDVTMQRADGEMVYEPYNTGWSPEKVSGEFVARACAAEHTVRTGRTADGYRMPHAGLTAVPRLPAETSDAT